MMLVAFSVFDAAAEAWLAPFFARSKGEAVRLFEGAANTADHRFHKHASDYTLFQIGSFDDLTGRLEASSAPLALGNALEFVQVGPGADRRADVRQLELLKEANGG